MVDGSWDLSGCSMSMSKKAALVRSTKDRNIRGKLGREAFRKLEDGFRSRYDPNTVFSCIKLAKNR